MLQRSPAMDGSPGGGTAESADGVSFAAASFLRELPPLVAMLAGAMSLGCGLVLAVRRVAGAIAAPSGPEAVLAVCGAGLVMVAAGDLAMRAAAARARGPAVSWLPAALTRLGLIMAMATVCVPLPMTWNADALTTIAAAAVSLVAVIQGPVVGIIRGRLAQGRRAAAPRRPASRLAAQPSTTPVPMATPFQQAPRPPVNEGSFQAGVLPSPTGSLLQRFERLSLSGGAECVRGRVHVAVPKGARSGYGHVGFCPPMASQPTVDVATDYDGVEAVVSAAEVLPWGVRIECRLDEPAEETIEIPVDILATTSS